jgi:hypothetical protein
VGDRHARHCGVWRHRSAHGVGTRRGLGSCLPVRGVGSPSPSAEPGSTTGSATCSSARRLRESSSFSSRLIDERTAFSGEAGVCVTTVSVGFRRSVTSAPRRSPITSACHLQVHLEDLAPVLLAATAISRGPCACADVGVPDRGDELDGRARRGRARHRRSRPRPKWCRGRARRSPWPIVAR